uniref:ComF family protein n=1 Tax=candidate division WWE3 bacterium TaxID=2053526 RepID=A0A832E0R1_UNCKA
MNLLNRVLGFVFPTRCVSCGRAGALLCGECLFQLEPLEALPCIVCGKPAVLGFTHPVCRTRWAPERFLAAFPYQGPARRLVQALKYKRLRAVAKIMVELLIAELREMGIEFGPQAQVVPIPLSFWRKGARGFNQSELLGRELAENLRLEFRSNLLRKIKDTSSQVSLDRPERQANVRGVFAVSKEFYGRDIILVDDVVTTGSTVREAAHVLKKAGAGQVWVLAFAQD